MKLAWAAGIAAGGLAFSAFAHEAPRIDADQDGWVTRAEAGALAERVFADLDTNDDSKLDATDHAHHQMFELDIEQSAAPGAQVERRVERHGEGGDDAHVERHVIIRRGDGGEAELDLTAPPPPPHAVMAPLPPRPPMFMMLIANNEEADSNGDGAMSLEEFRAQHLRFFDASDANGDGRIRFTPPELPEPPQAPEPPRPPR